MAVKNHNVAIILKKIPKGNLPKAPGFPAMNRSGVFWRDFGEFSGEFDGFDKNASPPRENQFLSDFPKLHSKPPDFEKDSKSIHKYLIFSIKSPIFYTRVGI
jgi:hypothetical protein